MSVRSHPRSLTYEPLEGRTVMSAETLVPQEMLETEERVNELLGRHLPAVEATSLPAADQAWDKAYQDLDVISDDRDALQDHTDRLHASESSLRSIVEVAERTLHDDEATEDETRQALDTVSNALVQSDATRASLGAQRDLAVDRLASIDATIVTTQKTLQEKNDLVKAMQEEIKSLTDRINEYTMLIKDLTALSNNSALRNLRYKATQEAWVLDVKEIKRRLTEANQAKAALTISKSSLQKDLPKQVADVNALQKSLTAAQAERRAADTELTRILKELHDADVLHDDLLRQHVKLSEDLACIRLTIVEDQKALESARKAVDDLMAELATVTIRLMAAIDDTETALADVLALHPPLAAAYDEALRAIDPSAPRLDPLPVDAAWPMNGAPVGSLGAIPHPGRGNDYDIDISPNGTEILASSQLTPQVQILDGATGAVISTLPNQGGIVTHARYSTDGRSIITASYDRQLRIYDRATLALTLQMAMPNLATHVEATRDGNILVESHECGLWLIDSTTGTIIDSFGTYATVPTVTKDGLRLVYGDENTLHRRFLPTGDDQSLTLPASVTATTVTQDGALAIAGDAQGMLRIIDMATGNVRHTLETGMGTITMVEAAPERLIVGGRGILQTYTLAKDGILTPRQNTSINGTIRGIDVSPSLQSFVVNAAVDAPGTSHLIKFPLLEPTPYTLDDRLTPDVAALSDDAMRLGTIVHSFPDAPPFAAKNAPIAERIDAVYQRGIWLQQRSQILTDIAEHVAGALIATDDPLARSLARSLALTMQEHLAKEQAMLVAWQQEESAVAATSDRLMAIQHADTEPIVERTDRMTMSPIVAKAGEDRIARAEATLPRIGGSLGLQGLTGRGNQPSSLAVTEEHPGQIRASGSTLALDFSKAQSSVTKITLTIDAQNEGDTVRILALGADGLALSTTEARAGSSVTIQEPEGMRGVLISATRIPYSPNAARLADHLAQNKTADSFFAENSWLLPQRAAIEREIATGELYVPLSISDLNVTGNIASPTEERESLNPFTSAAYSVAAAPTLTGVWFPENYASYIHVVNTYSQTGYTGIRPIVYGSGPELMDFQYPTGMSYGQYSFARIPKEFIRKVGDTLVLAPLGQKMRFGVTTNGGGQIYRADLAVDRTYDYMLSPSTGATLADVLPTATPRIDGSIDVIRTINAGQPPGTWVQGKSLQYSGSTPVALGTLRALTSYMNPSSAPLPIVITVYSGYAGTPGWDSPQATYTTTVGPGQSKQLWVQANMLANEAGGSVFRVKVTSPTGLVYMDAGRTILAPGRGNDRSVESAARQAAFMNAWNQAMTKAAADAKDYLRSIGVTDIPSSAFDVPPPTVIITPGEPTSPEAERLLRAAARALASAKESGDVERIDGATKMYANALTTYGTAIGLERGNDVVAYQITQLAQLVGSEINTEDMLRDIAHNIDAYRRTAQTTLAATEQADISLGTSSTFLAELGGMSDEAIKAAYGEHHDPRATEEMARLRNWSVATSWLRPQETSEVLNEATIAGKIALGLAHRVTEETKVTMASQAASVLGIPSAKILSALHKIYPNQSPSYETWPLADLSTRIKHLRSLLEEGQYKAAVRKETLGTSQHLSTPQPNKYEFTPDDQEIVLRFDTDLPAFHHASAYLVDVGGTQLTPDDATKLGEVRHGLEMRIPIARLTAIIGSINWTHVRIRLQVLDQDGHTVHHATTAGFALEGSPVKFLSTLPTSLSSAADIRYQNEILTLLSRRFPIAEGLAEWKWDLGSPYHRDTEYHAMDLNHRKGGDSDYGLALLLPDNGVIVALDPKLGMIRIQHTSGQNDAKGKARVWYTQFDHVPLEQDADGTIWIRKKADINPTYPVVPDRKISMNEVVKTTDYDAAHPFAVVGKNDTKYSHLHVSFLDDALRSIDPRLLMHDIAPDLKITAMDGGDNGIVSDVDADQNEKERDVVWNEDFGWVTSDDQSSGIANEHLVYDRSAQKNGGQEVYWMAWEEGVAVEDMKKVVWKKLPFIDDDGKLQDKEIWIMKSDENQRWNDKDQLFVPRIPS